MSVMRDPVMEPDGFSYEREAIEKWIRKHGTSPMTRRPLRIEDLKPNRALKDAIEEEYQKKKGGEKKKVGEDGTTPPPIPIPAPVSTNMNIRAGWSDNDTFALSFEPNDLTIPIPSDIVVVVDTSGSMQSEASVKNESGKKESNGLSVLDIVKHAARTIVHTMNEHDRFSLVEFNSEASVVCEPMYMTGTNCKAASIAIGSLRAGGRTNLWGGLEAALKTLLIPTPTPKRIQTVMLLTDGVPNIVPPRGHVHMLRKFAKKYFNSTTIPCRIFTFGFGYELDSEMLSELANAGNGSYNFIPTAAMVGTVFVNAISNIRTTIATNAKIELDVPVSRVLGHDTEKDVKLRQKYESKDHTSIDVGPLFAGQSRTIMLRIDAAKVDKSKMNVRCAYSDISRNGTRSIKENSFQSFDDDDDDDDDNDQRKEMLIVERFRLDMVSLLREITKMSTKHKKPDSAKSAESASLVRRFANNLEKAIEKCKHRDVEERLDAMLTDIEGEILLAVTPEHYFRWGRHYLLSLLDAHRLELCNNFKDKSVASYGGKLFKKLQSKADDTFCDLPPPKPSRRTNVSQGNVYGQLRSRNDRVRGRGRGASSLGASSLNRSQNSLTTAQRNAAVNMRASYYNSRAPCFSGESKMIMTNGMSVRVCDVRVGDRVQAIDGSERIVKFVVKTSILDGMTHLVRLGPNIRITPYHPVRINGAWCFPADVGNVKSEKCDAVYSFVVEMNTISSSNKSMSLCVGGIECASLGHGDMDTSTVHGHKYFGNRERVIRDLLNVVQSSDDDGGSGIINLMEGSCLRRDEKSGLVCGIGRFCD